MSHPACKEMEGVTIPHSRHTTESQKVFYDGPLQDGPASDFTKKLMSEECKASTILWKSAPVFFGFLVPRTCSLFLFSAYSGCGTAIDLGKVSLGDSQTQHGQFSKMNGIWGKVWLCRLWTPHEGTTYVLQLPPGAAVCTKPLNIFPALGHQSFK